ncbi:hypothetical protein Cylst_5849 [Cylindrospermum stagnale PCC 7417]|uniref:DUF4365 domain-containing protein n=1 Tax=Cylindrospermum stagnale PCC 7417 TaxID=56107 RepID=K9X5R8_9NOST|nr:hypothetical protein [Cylindrospermum stagnale]AFZ27833.1 hypothetical protein Cylst_5849 [Cylindrospermum stagnale PCC 7417]
MRSGISEFSYGYAVTEALIYDNRTSLTAAPFFPSLIDEGKKGYDLRLDRPGQPLFLQFKLSDYMRGRSNTTEIQKSLFTGAFYRMHLRPKKSSGGRHGSDQHQLLMDWESKGNEVYYVAPVFHELDDFNKAYLNHQILQRSIYIPPSDIGSLPDDKEHHVAFQVPGKAFRLSEPQEIPSPLSFEIFSDRLLTRLSFSNDLTLISSVQRLVPPLVEMYSSYRRNLLMNIPSIEQLQERFPNSLLQVAFLSKILFDCNFYIVQDSDRIIDIE